MNACECGKRKRIAGKSGIFARAVWCPQPGHQAPPFASAGQDALSTGISRSERGKTAEIPVLESACRGCCLFCSGSGVGQSDEWYGKKFGGTDRAGGEG